jgi:GNAT superfamily N-acetyltransferase
MCFLETSMLAEYATFRPGKRAEAEHRLAEGHRAILVCEGIRIVGCVWAATERAYVPYLNRDIILRPREMYTFDAFTHPDFRRRGVATLRNSFLSPEYRRQGYERAAGIVAFENHPGVRSAEAAGYMRQGVFGCVRLGITQIDLPGPEVGSERFVRPLKR